MSDELHAELATTLREHLLGTVGGEAPLDEFDCCADALIAGPLAELIRQAAIGRYIEACSIHVADERARRTARAHVADPAGYYASAPRLVRAALAAGSSSGISGKAGE